MFAQRDADNNQITAVPLVLIMSPHAITRSALFKLSPAFLNGYNIYRACDDLVALYQSLHLYLYTGIMTVSRIKHYGKLCFYSYSDSQSYKAL